MDITQLAAAWGLEVLGVKPYASVHTPQAVYRLTTPQGDFALKPFRLSTDQLHLMLKAVAQLMANGWRRLAPPIATLKGQPYLSSDGVNYLLVPWVTGTPMHLSARSDGPLLTRTLAAFHNRAKGLRAPWPVAWPERFAAQAEQLRALSREAERGYDAFDRLFAQWGPELANWAERAARWSDTPAYWHTLRAAQGAGQFAHNDYAGSNVLRGIDGKGWLIDLDTLGPDLPLVDVAKVIVGAAQWQPSRALELLNTYHGVRPLGPNDLKLLKAYLAMPREAWWAASRRYQLGVAEDRQLHLLRRTIESLPGRRYLLEHWP